MKIKKIHPSNLGKFVPIWAIGRDGYIHIHDSPIYGEATDEELDAMATAIDERLQEAAGIRADAAPRARAIAVERACRAIQAWQERS